MYEQASPRMPLGLSSAPHAPHCKRQISPDRQRAKNKQTKNQLANTNNIATETKKAAARGKQRGAPAVAKLLQDALARLELALEHHALCNLHAPLQIFDLVLQLQPLAVPAQDVTKTQ